MPTSGSISTCEAADSPGDVECSRGLFLSSPFVRRVQNAIVTRREGVRQLQFAPPCRAVRDWRAARWLLKCFAVSDGVDELTFLLFRASGRVVVQSGVPRDARRVVLLNVVLGCREQQSRIRDHCHLDLESSVRDWSFVSPSACWCAWILGSGRSPYALLGLVTLLLLSSRTSDCVRVMIETAVFSLRSTTGQPRDNHGTTAGQPRTRIGHGHGHGTLSLAEP